MLHDLGGRKLKVLTLPWAPSIIRHDDGNVTWYTGMDIDILEILASALNFTFEITEPLDQNYGSRLENGSWNGMIGMLQRKEADCALSLTITDARAEVSDHTVPHYYLDVVLNAALPDPSPVGWTFFLRPFDWKVYLLLGCGLVVTTALRMWLVRCLEKGEEEIAVERERGQEDKQEMKALNWAMSPAKAVKTLFGRLFARTTSLKSVSTCVRTLKSAWLLFSLVIIATYTGKLTSNYLIVQQPLPFNSLHELLQRTDYTWGCSKGTSIDDILSSSNDSDYREFFARTKEFAKTDPDVYLPLTQTVLEEVIVPKILAGHFVYLTEDLTNSEFGLDMCRMTRARERLFLVSIAIHLQKDSEYTGLFDQVLLQATDFGLIKRLERKWFPDKSMCQVDLAAAVPVSLELMSTPFIMAAVGLGLAAIVLLIERRVSQTSLWTRVTTGNDNDGELRE